MKSAEIKDMATKDLEERIAAEKDQLKHAVSPVENPTVIKKNRRDIARMLTILRQRNAK